MANASCRLKKQGFSQGDCLVRVKADYLPACRATLKYNGEIPSRLITSIHLSRPENYLSIYQSGCNMACRKCHSWHFSKIGEGMFYTPGEILEEAIAYEKTVTLVEPREKITAWHAHQSCRCCGACVLYGQRPKFCPGVLRPEAIDLSPQGFGPARNIVAFTGGDITCCPEFYGACAELIKARTDLWVYIETNGYGLTGQNLDYLMHSGVDGFWLDIKAFDDEKHRWMTGCSNTRILELPGEILKRDFVLEVLSLYIPGLIETEDLVKTARLLKGLDPAIPFTLLAFFPEYRMKESRSPSVEEMVEAYRQVKETGLENVRLGNIGIFAPTEKDRNYLMANVDRCAI